MSFATFGWLVALDWGDGEGLTVVLEGVALGAIVEAEGLGERVLLAV